MTGAHRGMAAPWLALLPTGCEVVIRTHKDRREKYGRLLAQITGLHGEDVTTMLIAAGHAKAWNGQGARP